MSKIDELIAQYCPDEVEFAKLGEVLNFSNGKGHEKAISENGNFIVVNSKFISTDGKVKKYSDNQISPLFVDDILLVMSDLPNGRALARTFFVDANDLYTLNQRICSLSVKDRTKLIPKFYYYLLNRNSSFLRFDNGVDQTNLRKDDILNLLIPVPPVPIQEEIVSILDKFTSLEAELEAELEARTRQYEYYRNQLLSFEGREVEWKTLGELTSLITKGTTPKKYFDEGITFIKTEAFDGSNINPLKLSFINEETHSKELKRSILKYNDILITIAGATIGKCAIVPKEILPANTNQALAIIRLHQNVNIKYVFYLLKSNYMLKYIELNAKGSAQPNLNLQQLNDFSIPYPPIEEQERIVATLDKFDALVNDISTGLPAEIQARRQQYEYYRGELLRFEPLHKRIKEKQH